MGKPAKPIRLMVSLLILKFVRNLSDENLVEHWAQNIYFQYFSLVDQITGIIMGAINFIQTLHDSKTIPEVLEQYERLNGKESKEVFVDRGYKGIKQYKCATIHVPKPYKNISRSKRKKHSRRSAIEPVIGQLRHDYRLCRNYL